MARQPDHPSGAAETICLSLSPWHRQVLDDLATAAGPETGRSAIIRRLLEEATPFSYVPEPPEPALHVVDPETNTVDETCRHPLTGTTTKGQIRRCPCGFRSARDADFWNDR